MQISGLMKIKLNRKTMDEESKEWLNEENNINLIQLFQIFYEYLKEFKNDK